MVKPILPEQRGFNHSRFSFTPSVAPTNPQTLQRESLTHAKLAVSHPRHMTE